MWWYTGIRLPPLLLTSTPLVHVLLQHHRVSKPRSLALLSEPCCRTKSWRTSPIAPDSQYNEAEQKLVPKRIAALAWFGLELCSVGFRAVVLQLAAFNSPRPKYCDPMQSRGYKLKTAKRRSLMYMCLAFILIFLVVKLLWRETQSYEVPKQGGYSFSRGKSHSG